MINNKLYTYNYFLCIKQVLVMEKLVLKGKGKNTIELAACFKIFSLHYSSSVTWFRRQGTKVLNYSLCTGMKCGPVLEEVLCCRGGGAGRH